MAKAILPILLGVALAAANASQAQGPADLEALKKLSILELGDIQVTSVSRTMESLESAAAAVTVISQQDIHRSGATSIPEALRGVPGIYVGRRNANSWAVSSRGFSSINSEKLLVLSDTRSIYTPLFSGVQWDVQNYIMEDIERIEVIRGPGATQWGSNAVNGVINITTRSARDTQGLYVEAGGGSEDRATFAIRNGGRIGSGHYRVFGQYFDRDSSELADASSPDDWHMAHAGFRSDWEAGAADAFTVQGDWYDGRVGQVGPAVTIIGRPGPPPPLRASLSGGNLLGRWKRALSGDSSLELRAYYDRTHRNDPSFHDDLDTVDLDFQHHLALPGQQLTWGLNYRRTSNLNRGKGVFAVDPARSRDELFSGFLQDQFALHERLHLTLGTKLEHNDFSGFEAQPSARLAWNLTEQQTLWAAVSRAVRVPSRLERDIAIEITPPGSNPSGWLLGNRDFDSEKLVAYELGYRWQASARLALDATSYYNRYKGLASLELVAPVTDPASGQTVFPIINQNLTDGRAVGGGLLVTYAPTDNWRLIASHAFLDLNLDARGQDNNRGEFAEGSTPRHQSGLRSSVDIGALRIDAFLRHISTIRSDPQIVSGEGIPAYTELDLRMAYLWNRFELAVALQNLLHDSHLEYGAPAHRGEIERSVRASIVWRR